MSIEKHKVKDSQEKGGGGQIQTLYVRLLDLLFLHKGSYETNPSIQKKG